jgi:hypothetical protein
MIQALKHMNIQLSLVLTDITGVTGLAMLVYYAPYSVGGYQSK